MMPGQRAEDFGTLDLDASSPSERDALEFGVVELDGEGTVLSYNAAESRLSGLAPAAVIGRNFFTDVAPCTNLPQFRGRFLHGQRRGVLDERFRFVFGFAAAPVLVDVRMRQAARPGRYWLLIDVLKVLPPGAHRLAAHAIARRAKAEPVDPLVCELEPIHLPGAVQATGTLIAVDTATWLVEACSANLDDVLPDVSPDGVPGLHLGAVLPGSVVAEWRAALASGALADPAQPLRGTLRLGPAQDGFAAAVHAQAGLLLIELERLPERGEDFGAATPVQAQDGVTALRRASDLAGAAQAAVHHIRAMTGFDRVLAYRFDAEWNGEALAEARAADWDDSLLGLRFPASDIPAQARALYARTPSRFVVDRDAIAVPLLGSPRANLPIDLSYARGRPLSPVHLEYQRNLGVNGSMSVSIMVADRLWGLMIGHHRRPHYVTPDTRALAGLVTDAFALRIHELESRQLWQAQQATLTVQNRLLDRMAGTSDVMAALTTAGAATLLDLFPATGAAVVSAGGVATVGQTPPPPFIQALCAWLRTGLPPGQTFVTDHLSGHYTLGEDVREIASGLLAVFVDEPSRDHVLLWFRREVVDRVAWGGDPNRPVMAEAGTGTVLPRRSFERWIVERRGHADPWQDWQVGTAGAVAAAVEGVMLRQQREIAALTTRQHALTRALEQKDVLAREIDHRVKNSLQIVAGVMLLQARGVDDPAAKAAFQDTYARVMSIARVHESLHQSETMETVDLGQTIQQLCGDLAAGMTGSDQRLEVEAEPGLMVPSQTAVALALVATELVTNALKYAYAPGQPGRVQVHVHGRPAGGVALRVCDTGRGLPPGWEARPKPRSGSGLGMRVIRAMLDQIGAGLAVDTQSPGVCFTVSI